MIGEFSIERENSSKTVHEKMKIEDFAMFLNPQTISIFQLVKGTIERLWEIYQTYHRTIAHITISRASSLVNFW